MFREKIANLIVKGRWYFFTIFIIATIGCALLIPNVTINYDITSYLPENSETKIALEIMENEFGSSGSANVMVTKENLTESEVTNTILPLINNVSGVEMSIFTDENFKSVDGTNYALIKIFFDKDDYSTETQQAITDIRTALDEYTIAMNGTAINASQTSGAVSGDMPIMIGIALLVILAILFLTSRSWLEPLIFFSVLGIAIVLNLGTNIIFPSISFITNSICIILQMALALDYSIILLHRFAEEQKKNPDPKKAMTSALAHCMSPVSASGLTTIAGLLALVFMQFTIGLDLGLVLAKGILISMIIVFLFMPSIILLKPKWLEKTAHRPLLPKMTFLSSWGKKIKWVMPFVMIVVIIGAFILQSGMVFSYNVNVNKEGQIKEDQEAISSIYGTTNSLIVLLPSGSPENEKQLTEYVLSLTDNDEYICSTSQSMVSVGAYNDYSMAEIIALIQSTTGTTLTTEQQTIVTNMFTPLFVSLDKNVAIDKVYSMDLLKYIQENNIVSKLEILSVYQNMHREITMAQAEAIYGLDEATTETIFYNVNGDVPNSTTTVEHYQVLLQMRNISEIFDNLTTEEQQQIISISGPMTYEQIMSVYQLGTDELSDLSITTSSTNIIPIYVINYLYFYLNDATSSVFCTATQSAVDNNYSALLVAQTMFESENYTRLIFNLNVGAQTQISFDTVDNIRAYIASNNLYTEYFVAGDSAVSLDIQSTFSSDVLKINLITVLALLIIILLFFRSLSIPLLLVTAIQGAIWINMAFFNVIGTTLFFMCYIITLCIQMGATIDYGILLTNRYMEQREVQSPTDAMKVAINGALPTIITSGSILCFSALIIGLFSSADVISNIGFTLCGGAFVSVLIILFVLPSILFLCDKLISKTTIKANFCYGSECVEDENSNMTDKLKKEGSPNKQKSKIINASVNKAKEKNRNKQTERKIIDRTFNKQINKSENSKKLELKAISQNLSQNKIIRDTTSKKISKKKVTKRKSNNK